MRIKLQMLTEEKISGIEGITMSKADGNR